MLVIKGCALYGTPHKKWKKMLTLRQLPIFILTPNRRKKVKNFLYVFSPLIRVKRRAVFCTASKIIAGVEHIQKWDLCLIANLCPYYYLVILSSDNLIGIILGMGRACFFWIGSSPSPYFLDRVEPGLQILYLEPMRAKKNSVWAYFEPQKYQWK